MADSPTTTTETTTTEQQEGTARSVDPPPPPTGPPSPASASWTPPPQLPPRWLPATVAVGLAAVLILGRVPVASIGSSLIVTSLAGALHLSGAVTSRQGRWCLLASVGFAMLLALRTDPRLVAFNVIATLVFLLIAVIGPERVFDWRPVELLGDAFSLVLQPFLMLGDMASPPDWVPVETRPERSSRGQLAIGILQGSAIAVPIVIVLAALLGSADVVFADLVSRGKFDIDQLWYASLRFSAGAFAVLILIGRTVRHRSEVPPVGLTLARTPTLTVLVALNAVFGLFVAAQLYALTGAGDDILADAGLTYRDYARQGFFQLLWVSGLTLLILLSLRSVAQAWYRGDRWFRWSSLATVVLTFGVVVVAFSRLQLYIADDGLTPLRFYSSVFSVWVAIGFVVVAVRLLGWRPTDAWTLPAIVASGLVVLAALNVANPEARIADNLVVRQDADVVVHMQKLTGDGQLVMANGLEEMNPRWAGDVRAELCENVPDDDSWLSWNLGRSRARSALLELC